MKFFVQGQRLANDLIHVVVAIGRKPSNEVDIWRHLRQRSIFGVNLRVARAGNWIIRISTAARIFVDDARSSRRLPGQMFELGYASVIVLVRIINHCHGLKPLLVERAMTKIEGSIRKLAIPKIEILIDRPGIDQLPKLHFIFQNAVIGSKRNLDVVMVKHVFEHSSKPMLRHCLKFVGEITVIAVGAYRDPSGHLGIKL